jgi:nucleolar protein 4
MPKSVENTVFVRFVPQPQHKVMRHQVEDIFSQMGPIKKSSWINAKPSSSSDAATSTTTSSKGYGFVKYVSHDDAQAASKELHDTKIQMEGQEYTLKVELASLSTPSSAEKSDKRDSRRQQHHHHENDQDDETSLLKKKSRIIVRNLSFYAKENHIRKVMESKYGKVLDVHLPKVQNNLHVGFCFVTFQDPLDAQKAVASRHVDIQKRTVNMDWSLPKNVHQQQQRQTQDRPVKGKHEEEDNNSGHSDDENNDKSHDSNQESDSDDSSVDNKDDGSDVSEAEQDKDEQDPDDDDKVPVDDSVGKGCCLFLRNLPFDATRHDLFQMFQKFGYVKGIYLVKDKDTGMLKGTAFVTYSKAESAQRALEQAASNDVSEEGVASFISQRKAETEGVKESNPKGSLLLKGRKIFVDLAVDKETAATFDSKEHQVPSADRRNLYLQAESRVESTSSDPNANNANTWDDLPPQDQKKRQHALKDKTTKLQSPIFFINPNRLSFRNMAKHVDEAGLQKLCELAVKRGLEKRLVGAKDQIAHWKALGELSTREILAKVQTMENNNEDVIPGWDDSTNIKEYIPSVFIDRDFGPNGKKSDAPSRGFGFAEFKHHAHALACLRELNNNPSYSREYAAGGKAADAMRKRARTVKKKTASGSGGGGTDYIGDDGRVHVPRLIVDFVVENKIKAKKQAERRVQQQLNQSKQKLENQAKKSDENPEKQKQSRGAKQREKKRQKRESGEEEAERQAELQKKAMAEVKRELRKERQEQKRKLKEDLKKKSVKPPKKKQKHQILDEDEEKLENIVRSYTSQLESEHEETEAAKEKNPRAAVKQKRWYE